MAFPAGKLPSSDDIANLGQKLCPSRSVAFTHGGVDLDLTDPAHKLAPCATEFYCTAGSSTSLVARLATDTVDQTYPCSAGAVIKGLFVVIRSTSTCDGLARQ